MYKEEDFEEIRPYYDHEVNAALKRIVSVPLFDKILEFAFPNKDKIQIKTELTNTYTALDFQKKFMYPLVYSIVNKTSNGLTKDGFEQLENDKAYLFVGNHRDIVLDSAILQVLLLDYGHSTSEITFGSNLMINQFIIDLGKVNRMFKVHREGNKMELLRNSQRLSAYIRYTITQKKVSAWIAQRGGRTKDGYDKTEQGLLKMFNMSGTKDFYESFFELNIVPLIISYEYEPCCAYKVRELYMSMGRTYKKAKDEDLISILTGITQPKGRIHMSVGTPLNKFLKETEPILGYNNKIARLAEIIDTEIYRHYRCWPTNYMAYDLLFNSHQYNGYYSDEDLKSFKEYMENEIKEIEGDKNIIRDILLKIYANPLINALK
jgi:1-acyl-sn-glycerol-3-phosphate acyltransferase